MMILVGKMDAKIMAVIFNFLPLRAILKPKKPEIMANTTEMAIKKTANSPLKPFHPTSSNANCKIIYQNDSRMMKQPIPLDIPADLLYLLVL
jgi:hypothetical protein